MPKAVTNTQRNDAEFGNELSGTNPAPVFLSEYNPEWPAKFEAERQNLEALIGDWLCGSIEHVGSTAVPGLIAKPVIDIMFGVRSLDESRPAIEVLANNGYHYFPYKSDVMHWFCKPSESYRTHHLHLITYKSNLWVERLQFRDALRSDKSIAIEYTKLKKSLADKCGEDREKYTQEKWPFIQNTLNNMREE